MPFHGVVGGMVDRELIHLQQGSQVQLPTRSNNFLSGGQYHNEGESPMLARRHSLVVKRPSEGYNVGPRG